MKHRATVQAAAVERGTRSLYQGLGIDLAVAVAMVLLMWLPDADLSSRQAWLILGTAAAKSVLTAAASYVMRLKIPPTEEAPVVNGAQVITRLEQ